MRRTTTTSAVLALPGKPGNFSSPDKSVSLSLEQPAYHVSVSYNAAGRVLERADRVWAHLGHSGWTHTVDVEMTREGDDGQAWVASCDVPCGQLQAFDHLELQMAFKGVGPGKGELWDNNGGSNWGAAVELRSGVGLVGAPRITDVHGLVSSLFLRIDGLAEARLLLPEHASMLRLLAWNHDFRLLGMYRDARECGDAEVAARCRERIGGDMRRPGLHVMHIAAEMAPIAKVGGLADVVTSLAKAHQATGTLAEILLPKYDCIEYTSVQELRIISEIFVPWGTERVRTVVWSGVTEGLPVYFLEPHSAKKFFWRGRFYGEADDAARFLFFSRAALEFLVSSGKQPDVLHVHDWQSACVAPLLRESYARGKRGLSRTGVVLTIHNIAFQGWLSPDHLEMAGLDREKLYTADAFRDDSRPGFGGRPDINMLKGGIAFADAVTTVSPTYAREVMQPAFGMGLEGVLAKHSHKFRGILNGIDHEMWSAQGDPHLPKNYSAADSEAGKQACKAALLSELGLPHFPSPEAPAGRPLLAMVSRLTEQKGLALMEHALRVSALLGAQVMLLGSAPDPAVQKHFEQLQAEFGRLCCSRQELSNASLHALTH
ncbi:hypothetical protein FOA52_015032 [Chlamydomonas sp. UWO 241]|nr:hypothetical protein FOA52_015032 [Chlamydomonas sp. UWO 241]